MEVEKGEPLGPRIVDTHFKPYIIDVQKSSSTLLGNSFVHSLILYRLLLHLLLLLLLLLLLKKAPPKKKTSPQRVSRERRECFVGRQIL